jgi:hypothetical protein
MRKLLPLIFAAAILSSCGLFPSLPEGYTNYGSLYYWGGTQNGTSMYEDLSYREYKKQSPESICALLCTYQDMVTHPGGYRKMPPPGICAEFGYLLLQPDTPAIFAEKATAAQKKSFNCTDYVSYFQQRGEELFLLEVEYYPESAKFILPLLKQLKGMED